MWIPIERLEPNFQGATITNPIIWDNAIGYMSNSWCWDCGTWTKHSYNDYPKLGMSERCCHNCGKHYAIALSVQHEHLSGWHRELIEHTNRELQEI